MIQRSFIVLVSIFLISTELIGQWYWQNPYPQGNRLNDMTLVEGTNTVFAVGAEGTVIRSDNKGRDWEMMDSITTYQLNGISFATPNKGYIVGEKGKLFTYNGSGQWTPAISGSFYDLNAIDFASDTIGCIVGYKGLILRKSGDDWEEISSSTNYALYAVDFASESVGVIVGDSGTILRTTNGGMSWNDIQNSYMARSLNDVYFPTEDVGYIAGQKGLILRSDNGGQSWEDISFTQIDANLLSIHFYDENNGYACGADGAILGTTDGGTNWSYHSLNTLLSFNEIIHVHPPVDTLCDTVLICGDYGAIFRTDSCIDNLGNMTGATTYSLSSIKFPKENSGYSVGGDPFNNMPYILHTDDGDNWNKIVFDTIDRYLSDIDFFNSEHAYISAFGGMIYKYVVDSVIPIPTGFDDHFYAIEAFDTTNIFAAGLNGALIRSIEGDDSLWSQINYVTDNHLFGLTFINQSWGYAVGDGGTLLRITDNGDQVTKINTGTTVPFYDLHFPNDSIGYIVGYDGKIFQLRIEDEVEELVEIPSGVTTPLNGVYFPDPDTGYIVGEGGVILKSTNRGNSWLPQYSGTSNGLRCIHFNDAQVGYVAGGGVTILKTENGGGNVLLPGIVENEPILFDIDIFPNPAINETRIEFELTEKSSVKICAYDLAGRKIETIVHEDQISGMVNYRYNTSALHKGLYLIVIEVNQTSVAKKLIILR